MHAAKVALAISLCVLLATPVWADKDKDKDNGRGPGQNQGQGQGQGKGRDKDRDSDRGPGNPSIVVVPQGNVAPVNIVIQERDRGAVYSYYRTEYATAGCPPGLAKKNNGCLPPGQAKKMWAMGQPLPAAVVYYPLPGVLLAQLSPAPSGYQYVRVANDILLMAIGTRMIASAIADLGSL
jgi:Ni/Co efflux regulator RcnB